MAFLLKREFPEADISKVVNMCLIHDLGECFTGDIPTFLKTDADRDVEDSLLDRWVQTLPNGVSDDMRALYAEMAEQKTLEAKLYKALDKLAADTKTAEGKEDALETAVFYESTVLKDMDELRSCADAAEALIPDKYLSYPTYGQMLFSLR